MTVTATIGPIPARHDERRGSLSDVRIVGLGGRGWGARFHKRSIDDPS